MLGPAVEASALHGCWGKRQTKLSEWLKQPADARTPTTIATPNVYPHPNELASLPEQYGRRRKARMVGSSDLKTRTPVDCHPLVLHTATELQSLCLVGPEGGVRQWSTRCGTVTTVAGSS
jgi:hypothetical protein